MKATTNTNKSNKENKDYLSKIKKETQTNKDSNVNKFKNKINKSLL
jgi:hypothetical protein